MRLRRRNSGAGAPASGPVLNLGSTPSRPRDAERATRRRLDPWDRSKYLILGSALFGFLWWQKLNDNPIKSVVDGFWETVTSQAWIPILLALEVLRQLHFVVAGALVGLLPVLEVQGVRPGSRTASRAWIRGCGSASGGCCGSCSGCCCWG